MTDPRRDGSIPLGLILVVVMGLLLIAGFNALVAIVRYWLGA